MKKQHPLVILGMILGASFILAAAIGAVTIFRIRALNDLISVTGPAKMEVVSDQAKWTTQIMRTVTLDGLKGGYDQLARDLSLTREFLRSQGITDEETVVSTVSMNEIYQRDDMSVKSYNLVQTIEVQSNDVDKLKKAAENTGILVGRGVIFSTIALEYYYSKLPEARIDLLSKAIEDARARASEMAKNSGRRVGSLKSATSGVVQVQSRNSTDVSDYGSYDTSKIDKQITVTVKATFSLK